MEKYLPYIVSIVSAIIAGRTSYVTARKQARIDLQKLERQHDLEIEKEREHFQMEKEKMEIEHRHQMELLEKKLENEMGTNIVNTVFSEAMKMPEVRQQLSQGMRNNTKKKH